MRNAFLVRTMATELHMNDFGKFYYSARAFLDGRDMYAPSPATELPRLKGLQFLNMNPPHFHLLVLPLALLSPGPAVELWMIASLMALILSILLIAREVNFAWSARRLLCVTFGALAFAASETFFATGQLSLLLMLAMTFCWLSARRGRWIQTGAWLGGCLSVKPFLLIFLPYLLATRRFRAAAMACAVAASCLAIGLLIFGTGPYLSWYRALSRASDWAGATMNGSILGFFRRIFDNTPYFTPIVVVPQLVRLWVLAAAVVGILTLAIAITDVTERSTDRAFALLLVASLLISPLGWVYYLWLPAGPAAALALARRGSRPMSVWNRGVVVLAVAGLLWPIELTLNFQPSGWATATLGSAYFWGTLALWCWLVSECRALDALKAMLSRVVKRSYTEDTTVLANQM